MLVDVFLGVGMCLCSSGLGDLYQSFQRPSARINGTRVLSGEPELWRRGLVDQLATVNGFVASRTWCKYVLRSKTSPPRGNEGYDGLLMGDETDHS
jgi:hypothetical protein